MGEYNICTDYLEIVSGTSNKASTVYREAANNVATGNEKSMKYLQNFLTSIETMAASSKTKDPTITASAGNIKECKSYENIKYALDFLNKNLSNLPMLKDLNTIYRSLESYQPQYTDGYRKKSRLVILEYENTVYMLIEGLAATMCTGIDYEHTGTKIKIKRKSGSTHEVINRLVANLAKELSKKDHKTYLESLIKASDEKPISKVEDEKKGSDKLNIKEDLTKLLSEYDVKVFDDNELGGVTVKGYDEKTADKIYEIVKSYADKNGLKVSKEKDSDKTYINVKTFEEPKQEEPIKESVEAFMEGNVRDIMDVAGVLFNAGKNVTKFGVNAVKAIKNSLFGIIPLIRSIMYLRYKRKADKITSLDQQVQFIQQNIEQLRNREGDMDPKKKEQIIKRQEAIIEAHKKKAEKLRAQLMEEEKEASNALKQDDPSMGKTNDEFVLEGCTLMEIFNEENLSNFF